MEGKPVIKMLDNSYCNSVIGLVLPIQQQEFNVAITVEDQPDLMDIEAYYIKPGGGFWGAVCGDVVVGTVALINVGGRYGVIRKMFACRDFRGREQGVANYLMQQLLKHARCAGLTDIYLGTVDNMKAAHRFYEKNGFVRVERQVLPAKFPFMPTDSMFYHLHLTDHNHYHECD